VAKFIPPGTGFVCMCMNNASGTLFSSSISKRFSYLVICIFTYIIDASNNCSFQRFFKMSANDTLSVLLKKSKAFLVFVMIIEI
jgi:hypothetical protein